MSGSLQGLHVLVVDDNPNIVALLKRYLATVGVAAAQEAHDGSGALEQIDATPLDLVLCDLDMPGMDGIELLRHLAARQDPPAVILLSGQERSILNTAVRLGRAHGLRVVGALSKPFRLPPLRALLEQAAAGADSLSRARLEPLSPEAVRAGIGRGAVELAFQPKVAAGSGTLAGVETFLRWRDTDGRLKHPAAVVPVAERSGLIHELTRVVVRRAMKQQAAWQAQGHRFTIAINVSMRDLERYDFPEFVVAAAEDAGIELSSVLLEVTESQIMADVVRPLEVLSRLRLKGVGLSIDDYGTGASSMQQLKRIPFTELKIDREFVSGAPEDPEAQAMLSSSITLGKDLGLAIVAEGVETASEWDLVVSRGVDIVQGYFVARPMAAMAMTEWLSRQRQTLH